VTFSDTHFESAQAIWDDLIVVLRRRVWMILGITLAVTVGAYLAIMSLTDLYESEARLLVKVGRENTQVPMTVESGNVYTAAGVQGDEINSYIQLLTSQSVIETVVNRIGLANFAGQPAVPKTLLAKVKQLMKLTVSWGRGKIRQLLVTLNLKTSLTEGQRVVAMVQKSLQVSRQRESRVIRVALRLPDSQLAQRVVDMLLQVYLERHIEVHRVSEQAIAVFDDQTNVYRRQLQSLHKMAREIKEQWHLSSVSEQRSGLLNRLHDLKREIDESHSRAASLKQERISLEQKLVDLPRDAKAEQVIEPNPSARTIRERLVDLQIERAHTTGRYAEDTRQVQVLDEEIAALTEMLGQAIATEPGAVTFRPNPLQQAFERRAEQIDVELTGLLASMEQHRAHVVVIEQDLRQLNEGEYRLKLVELERRVAEQKYVNYAERREEARIAEALNLVRVANIAVLSGPTVSSEPVSPRKLLLMATGVLVGAMLGVGAALVRQWLRPIVYDVRDLEGVAELPLLGVFRPRVLKILPQEQDELLGFLP